MIEMEVMRLRQLRAVALQARGVARTLRAGAESRVQLLASQVGCAAWRVARAATGRLRAHPNASCQRDAGLSTLLVNSLVASMAALHRGNRLWTALELRRQLGMVQRELADVRALTWAPELSDTLGRSLKEVRQLMAAVEFELGAAGQASAIPAREVSHLENALPVTENARHVSVNGDWPFLAI